MDLNTIIQMGAEIFKKQLDQDHDGQLEVHEVTSALSALFTNSQGQVDIAALLNNVKGGDLLGIVASWLSDGPNQAVQPNQLAQIFGDERIAAFAEKLGLSPQKALNGLTEAVPVVVDKSSNGGSLLDMVGGIEGALALASKLLAR